MIWGKVNSFEADAFLANDTAERAETRPRMAALPYRELLAQCQVFEEKTSTGTEEANERPKAEPDESKQSQGLYQNAGETAAMQLTSKPAGVLANDRLSASSMS